MLKIKFDNSCKGYFPKIIEVADKYFGGMIETDAPDYVFCGPYSYDYLNYGGVRIFYTGENLRPDFNLVDYAIGFDELKFGDRYLRVPLYYLYVDEYKRAIHKHEFIEKSIREKHDFCNFVYSNDDADPVRNNFFELLSKYKKVDSGGKVRNNVGSVIPYEKDAMYNFQRKYKFSIAFENTSTPGYTTEKILQAFAAGTVPIYWGDPHIAKEFNEKAFINCMNYASFEDVVNEVIRLDIDDSVYMEYLSAPIFNEDVPEIDYDAMLEEFFKNIFLQGPEKAVRRSNRYWGQYYQEDMRKFRSVEHSSAYTYLLRFKGVK